MLLTLGTTPPGMRCSRKEGKICSPLNLAQPGGIYADEFDRDRQILLFGTQRRRQARTASVLLSSRDKRACMPPIHGELDGCFSRLTKVPRKHSPFPQQLIRLNGLAAGALRQKRATASFFPARLLRSSFSDASRISPNSPIFGSDPS